MNRTLLARVVLALLASSLAVPANADGIGLRMEIGGRAVADLLVCRGSSGRASTATVVRAGAVVCGPSAIALTGRRSGGFDCGGSPFAFGPLPGTTILAWSYRGRRGTMRLVR